MPATTYFTSQSFSSLGVAIPQIVRYLMNDHGSITGPGWTLVEAQSGANREVPSDPTNLDSLVSATDWLGTIAVNDWVVLESAGGNVTTTFQMYLEYQTTTTINLMLMPFADFTTGEVAVSPPWFPIRSIGAGSGSFVVMTGFSSDATYSAVADEGVLTMLFDDNSAGVNWMYVGEVDSPYNSGSVVLDERPFVIYDSPNTVGWFFSNAWNRISPVDEEFELTAGAVTGHPLTSGKSVGLMTNQSHAHNNNADLINGLYGIAPMGVAFTDSGHDHFMGWLRNCYSVSDTMYASGTIKAGADFVHRNDGVSAGICLPWVDGVAYGSASNGVLMVSPERSAGEIGFFTIPRLSPEGGVTTITLEADGLNVDKSRLKNTYSFRRIKRNPGNLS